MPIIFVLPTESPSSNSLIALMLGRLRMSVDDATIAYVSIADKIFSRANKKMIHKREDFKASTLETAIKQLVAERTESDEKTKPTNIEGVNTSQDNVDALQRMMDPRQNACKT
jgi:hypothetical protein